MYRVLSRTTVTDANRLRARVLAIAIIVFAAGLWFLGHRRFDIDELEHAHAAWNVAQGSIPYRDFFEHHPPALYLLSAPLFRAMSPGAGFEQAKQTLLLCRVAMWLLAAIVIVLTHRLGTHAAGSAGQTTSLWAVFLLATSFQFLNTTMEFRPDVPAVVCVLTAFVCALEANQRRPQVRWWLVAAGTALGVSLTFTQKAIFAVPGLVLFVAATNRRRMLDFTIGVLAPVVLVSGWFAANGALFALVDSTIVRNVAINNDRTSALPGLFASVLRNLPLYGLGLTGVAMTWRGNRTSTQSMLLVTLVSLGIGLVFIGRVYDQYYLLMLPLLAVFAAGAITESSPRQRRSARWIGSAVSIAAVGLLAAVVALRYESNDQQLADMRLAMDQVRPDETVLSGIPGAGTFRPHAWYYFFLVGPFANARDFEALQLALDAGRIRPRLVVFDTAVRTMPPGVLHYLRAHYRPLRDDLYVRLD
jgi:4-amino-4-deoxy-L-arabinose transferase-like glycosyltransferase